jgi:hypothetical protein
MTIKHKNQSNSVTRQLAGLWQKLILSEQTPKSVEIGPLTVSFRKILNEVWIASERTGEGNADKLTWLSWAFDTSDFQIYLRPMLPDRMLTVKPETPFRLAKNAQIRVYSRVPVWVGVYSGSEYNHKLLEIPTVELSKTWFGDMFNGTLSYWLPTRASRVISSEMYNVYTSICTFNIHNTSGEELVIDKINLPVERLGLYFYEGQLYSDEMDITYKGGEQKSDIFMQGKAPAACPEAVFISPPRNPLRHSLAERIIKGMHLF